MKTCPYCKIDFQREPWAAGTARTVCKNCRFRHEHLEGVRKDAMMRRLFEKYEALPYFWETTNGWQDDPQYLRKVGQ